MHKKKPMKKNLAKRSAPAASNSRSHEHTSSTKKDGTKQIIFIAIVALAAIIFFGYVYFTSSVNSEAKSRKDRNVMEQYKPGDTRMMKVSGMPEQGSDMSISKMPKSNDVLDIPERGKGRL